ncbi:N-acetyltransferase [Nocardia panacis]|uniref:N-acetyltransferase n=1 Tax=Nocardia panacis TaxID=2340916 RepID=A0A3A4K5F0_9NOCA|nr:GNAT family N-acetyltransferase [Nocardia panacis]RJO72295.1 N-acetyltransferase [Nocardia panacis]
MTKRLAHNAAATRFEIYLDDTLAGYADYADNPETKVREFHHTMTFPEFRGRGVAADIVRFALDDSRAQGFSVIPTCWYVDDYITAHPEYADLVA